MESEAKCLCVSGLKTCDHEASAVDELPEWLMLIARVEVGPAFAHHVLHRPAMIDPDVGQADDLAVIVKVVMA